jgi:putative transposase
VRDEHLKAAISRVYADNYGGLRGPEDLAPAEPEGTPVARCTVERLMRELGLAGARCQFSLHLSVMGVADLKSDT